jgi:carboxyl-terminal processing protease
MNGRFTWGIGRALVAAALIAVPVGSATSASEDDLGYVARMVAEASSEGELSRALATLGEREEFGGDVRSAAARYEQSLKKREEVRTAKLEEVNEEFTEHLEAAEKADAFVDQAIALADAVRSAVEMQVLTVDEAEFMAAPRIRRLIENAEAAAQRAESEGEWMLSNELYAMLGALLEDEGAYREDINRLGQRLAMIRLYAPKKFRDLVAEHRDRHGDDAPPPYNPYGDSFEEKLEPITARAVERSLQHAAFKHVDMASQGAMGPMLVSGLTAVETLVTTGELAEVLPGLTDERAREEFLRFVRSQRTKIRDRMDDPRRGVGLSELDGTIDQLLSTNRFTIDLSQQALLHEFGNGAMQALDDYSAIIWPDEIKRFQRSTRGEFVGVGIQIEMDDMQNIRVVTPLEGTPAQRAGIQTGDLIKKVDGHSTVGFTLDQAVEVITGPKNTSVTLTVERGEDEDKREIDFTLERKRIELPTVRGWHKTGAGDDVDAWDWFVDEGSGIGYIRITSFSNNTTDRFDEAVRQMRREGLSGLILDLRFNPGGLLDEAVSIANRFVPEGVIVKTEDAAGSVRSREFARRLPKSRMLDDIPVAVLINEGSASASEIVSGAIQAEARASDELDATIIGKRTFGKGSVQNVFSLDQSAMMKLTTQYYKLRGDRIIHRRPGASAWGIEPDIEVEMLPDQILEAAKIRRDADVLAIDERGNIIPDPDRPDPDKLLDVGVDLQLQTALVLLQSQIQTGEMMMTAAED